MLRAEAGTRSLLAIWCARSGQPAPVAKILDIARTTGVGDLDDACARTVDLATQVMVPPVGLEPTTPALRIPGRNVPGLSYFANNRVIPVS